MSLYRRGKVWHIKLYVNGRAIRQTTHTTNKALALQIEAQKRLEIAQGRHGLSDENDKRIFGQLASEYMSKFTSAKTLSSIKRDEQLLAHLLPIFGKLPLKGITPALIINFKLQRREQGAAPKTVNLELGLARHIVNIGIQLQWATNNPFRGSLFEKLPPLKTRWFSDDEIKKLYEVAPDWLKPVITLALHTGLRQSDVLNLKWENIDFEREIITLQIMKTKRMLGIPINSSLKGFLSELRRIRHIRSDYVLHDREGNRLSASSVQHAFKFTCRKVGIQDASFHTLRHSVGTKLAQNGISLYQIQALFGHATPTMSMRYAHLIGDSLRPAVNVLNNMGTGTKTGTQTGS